MEFHLYTESEQRDLPVIAPNENINAPNLYIPSKGLINAVNVALALGQPLLLTGEPGTGKTRLAHHIAWIFKLGDPLRFNAINPPTRTWKNSSIFEAEIARNLILSSRGRLVSRA